jgi:putative hemolysin
MRLGDRPVRAVMTPRGEVDMIDLTDEPDLIHRRIIESVHSRLPVHKGRTDEMLGVIQAKDLLNACMRGEHADVRALVRHAPIIPDTADALDVVETIKQSPVHIALILDEYGDFEGIVTNADILEAIVGAFKTDEGPPEPEAVRREDGSWLISGGMPVDEMAERLSISVSERRTYHTAAGFVLHFLGQLPSVGETFVAHGWRFEVVDMDGRRIDKILAKRLPRGGR